MDFFDKLGEKASKTYKYTTEKTAKLAKEAKLKMSMNENKSKIEDLYSEIGKKVYENHIREEDIDVDISLELEEYCIQIDELSDRIEDERKEILNLKDKRQCDNCYYEIDIDYNYCPHCGQIQEKVNEDQDEVKEEITHEQIAKDIENIVNNETEE